MSFNYRLGERARALDKAAIAYADAKEGVELMAAQMALFKAATRFAKAKRKWDKDHALDRKVRMGICVVCGGVTEYGVLGRPKKYCDVDCYKEGRRRAAHKNYHGK